MGKTLNAAIKSKNTTITALITAIIAILSALLALFDGDASTAVDMNLLFVSALAGITALQGLLSRDADKSSQDVGIEE